MAKGVKVEIYVDANGDLAIRNLQNVGNQGGKAFDHLSARAVAVGQIMANLATKGVQLLISGIGKLGESVGTWIEASNAQEDALGRVDQALKAAGQFTPELGKQYEDLASKIQATTTVADDLASEGIAKLIAIGGVHKDQMEAATMAAIDLAEATGKDVSTAFEMVAKAAGGHTEALGKLGIEIKATGNANTDLANTIRGISELAGGQAAAAVTRYNGAMKQMENSAGDLQETLGDIIKFALAPMMKAIADTIPLVQEWLNAHKAEAVVGLTTAMSYLVEALYMVISAGASVAEAYGEIKLLFFELSVKVFQPFIDTLYAAALGTQLFAESLGLPSGEVERFADQVDRVREAMNAGLGRQRDYAASMGALAERVKGVAGAFRDKLQGALEDAAKRAQDTDLAFQHTGENLRKVAEETVPVVSDSMAYMADRIKDAGYAGATMAGQIGDACAKALASIETVGQKMDKMLAENTKALDRFAAAKASIDLGDGETVEVDKSSSVYKALEARAKELAADSKGFVAQFSKGFAAALKAGNIGAMAKLVEAVRHQAEAIGKIPGGGAVQGDLRQMAGALESLLGQFRDLAGAPGRARGGPVKRGQPYWVGEEGPEPFVPDEDGMIYPAHRGAFAMPGGGGAVGGDGEMRGLLRELVSVARDQAYTGREAFALARRPRAMTMNSRRVGHETARESRNGFGRC